MHVEQRSVDELRYQWGEHSALEKLGLWPYLKRLSITPIPGTPKLLQPLRSATQLDDLERGWRASRDAAKAHVAQRLKSYTTDKLHPGGFRVALERGIDMSVENPEIAPLVLAPVPFSSAPALPYTWIKNKFKNYRRGVVGT